MILSANEAHIAQAAQALRDGQLLGLPTETVYGLAANACDDAAVAKIFAAKGRPADHPLIVHVASVAQVPLFAAQVPEFAQRLMATFWPGPLTLILPRLSGVAAASAGGQDSIGLRCPSHPVAQALLKAAWVLGVEGVSAPSANRFGRVSPTTVAHVQEELGAELLILDGGECDVGIESTIIDCTRGEPVLLRPGQITRAQIETACGRSVLQPQDLAATKQTAPRASGTLASHYAPRARVRLLSAPALQAGLRDAAGNGSAIAVYARTLTPLDVLPGLGLAAALQWRQMPPSAAAAAQQLFALLRELDRTGVTEIWVETPPDTPDWAGVRDRLSRAAA